MNVYIKHLSKRTEEDKEKTTAAAYLGSTMISHGDDFEPDSEFGQCLQSMHVFHRNSDTSLTSNRLWPGERACCTRAGELRDCCNLDLA